MLGKGRIDGITHTQTDEGNFYSPPLPTSIDNLKYGRNNPHMDGRGSFLYLRLHRATIIWARLIPNAKSACPADCSGNNELTCP